MKNISDLFNKIHQGENARKKIESNKELNEKIDCILKEKGIRYRVKLTKIIIISTINRCVECYGSDINAAKFEVMLEKSIKEQHWIYCLKHYKRKDNRFDNDFEDKLILLCHNVLELELQNIDKSDVWVKVNESFSKIKIALMTEKYFTIYVSLEKYLKITAKRALIKFAKENNKKSKQNPNNSQNSSDDSVEDDEVPSNDNDYLMDDYSIQNIPIDDDSKSNLDNFFKDIYRISLQTFYGLQESDCKNYFRRYYHPVLMYMYNNKFKKDELEILAQNELEEIEKIQDQPITKKLKQKAALEQTGIPPKGHPAREHKRCLEEWQKPLLHKLLTGSPDSPDFSKKLAKFIDHFKKEHLKKKKITPAIHEN